MTGDSALVLVRRRVQPLGKRRDGPPKRIVPLRESEDGVTQGCDADDRPVGAGGVTDKVVKITPGSLLVGDRPLQAGVTPDILKLNSREKVAGFKRYELKNREDSGAPVIFGHASDPVRQFRAVRK